MTDITTPAEAIQVLQLRGRDVRNDAGSAVAVVTGGVHRAGVEDPEGRLLLSVESSSGYWFARRPDGEALLRIDPGTTYLHTVTYADGRTGRLDSAPVAGAWELDDGRDGRLVVHARSVGGRVLDALDWRCAQDGTLSTTDFLATVLTCRGLHAARRRFGHDLGVEW